MLTRTGKFDWITGPFRNRVKAKKLRERRVTRVAYSAWVDSLESRELLSASPTISFNLTAPTSLANQGIYVGMYGNIASPPQNSSSLTVQYAIEWDTNGNAQQVTAGSFVETTQLSFTPNGNGTSSVSISIPDIPNGNTTLGFGANTYQLNGARLVFGIGHSPYLSVSSGTKPTVAAPAPSSLNDPNTAQNYDFVEFTLDQAGMHINTTTVDQFGFPITVSATPTTTVRNNQLLSSSTLTVNSTAGFPSQGTVQVTNNVGQIQNIKYTSTNGTQFLGCSGGMGTANAMTPVWSVSNYITSSGVGVQLDRQDVFNGFSTFVGSTSPFIKSVVDGNTTSAGSIYLPAPASNFLSTHSGSGNIQVKVFNVSPDDPLLKVNFGSTSVTPVGTPTYDPSSKVTTITVTPPALSNTTVDVTVTSTGGTSPTYLNLDYYTFGNGGTPTVTSLSAVTGPLRGGNKVIITGSNFSDPNLTGGNGFQVMFGNTPAAFNVLSTTAIMAYVPQGVAGSVNVSVTMRGQTAANTPTFTYVNLLPVVTSLSSSDAAPGSTITIKGYNFVKNHQTTVNFGKYAGTNVVVYDANTLTVTVPAGKGGVDVTVTTPIGTSPVTFDDRYIFPSVPTYSATNSLRLVNPSDILAIESNPPVSLYAKVEPGGQLTSNTTYYYVVTATSHTGESIASSYQSAQANGIPGYNSIALAWTPFLNANGYNIYRSTSSTGPFQYLAHVNGGPSSKFLDDGSATPTSKQPPSNIYTYDPLASYFDKELLKFFKHYAPVSAGGDGATFVLPYGSQTYYGNTLVDGAGRTYLNIYIKVMVNKKLVDQNVCKIYQPFFNTNTNNPNNPPPPPGLAINTETPGQMVFSGDGVFALDTGAHSLDIENVIVAAFNRGIATKFHIPPSSWGNTPSQYYTTGSTANWYAAYMHQSNVSISDNRPASLGGPQPLAYGFAYDDQAGNGGNGYGSYFTTPAVPPVAGQPIPNGSFGININFGSWTPATKVSIVSPPKFDVNNRPVDFKVQLIDDNGKAVFQGGKEITLQVVGPFNLTTTYTLITAADGTATGRSTSTGRPVEINIPGDFELKFSAPGFATQTGKLRVDLASILLKSQLEVLSLLQHA